MQVSFFLSNPTPSHLHFEFWNLDFGFWTLWGLEKTNLGFHMNHTFYSVECRMWAGCIISFAARSCVSSHVAALAKNSYYHFSRNCLLEVQQQRIFAKRPLPICIIWSTSSPKIGRWMIGPNTYTQFWVHMWRLPERVSCSQTMTIGRRSAPI